jgi:hypothetical protein
MRIYILQVLFWRGEAPGQSPGRYMGASMWRAVQIYLKSDKSVLWRTIQNISIHTIQLFRFASPFIPLAPPSFLFSPGCPYISFFRAMQLCTIWHCPSAVPCAPPYWSIVLVRGVRKALLCKVPSCTAVVHGSCLGKLTHPIEDDNLPPRT